MKRVFLSAWLVVSLCVMVYGDSEIKALSGLIETARERLLEVEKLDQVIDILGVKGAVISAEYWRSVDDAGGRATRTHRADVLLTEDEADLVIATLKKIRQDRLTNVKAMQWPQPCEPTVPAATE